MLRSAPVVPLPRHPAASFRLDPAHPVRPAVRDKHRRPHRPAHGGSTPGIVGAYAAKGGKGRISAFLSKPGCVQVAEMLA